MTNKPLSQKLIALKFHIIPWFRNRHHRRQLGDHFDSLITHARQMEQATPPTFATPHRLNARLLAATGAIKKGVAQTRLRRKSGKILCK